MKSKKRKKSEEEKSNNEKDLDYNSFVLKKYKEIGIFKRIFFWKKLLNSILFDINEIVQKKENLNKKNFSLEQKDLKEISNLKLLLNSEQDSRKLLLKKIDRQEKNIKGSIKNLRSNRVLKSEIDNLINELEKRDNFIYQLKKHLNSIDELIYLVFLLY